MSQPSRESASPGDWDRLPGRVDRVLFLSRNAVDGTDVVARLGPAGHRHGLHCNVQITSFRPREGRQFIRVDFPRRGIA